MPQLRREGQRCIAPWHVRLTSERLNLKLIFDVGQAKPKQLDPRDEVLESKVGVRSIAHKQSNTNKELSMAQLHLPPGKWKLLLCQSSDKHLKDAMVCERTELLTAIRYLPGNRHPQLLKQGRHSSEDTWQSQI